MAKEILMQEYQKRVIDEKAQLDERLAKLSTFFRTVSFEHLLDTEQQFLTTQMHLMVSYSAVLGARIAAFSE